MARQNDILHNKNRLLNENNKLLRKMLNDNDMNTCWTDLDEQSE